MSESSTATTAAGDCSAGDATVNEARTARLAPGWFGRKLLTALSRLRHGRLTVRLGEERFEYGLPTPDELTAEVVVHDVALFRRLALGGSVAAGDAYLDHAWSTNDLTAFLRIICRNFDELTALEGGLARFSAFVARGVQRLTRNTRRGSRKNIARHYDLGDDFFELFLDPTLMYSSAVFDREAMSLEDASIAKLDRVCRTLDLRPDDHVVEIGAGWGGFALHAARHFGCRVTTTTISRNQFEVANRRIRDAGLGDRVTLLARDYRDLDHCGPFDKLVSIEMIEAVGHEFLPRYFRACDALLKPGGAMLVQAIVMPEPRYDAYRRSTDFIRKHVFPGGHLPSIGAMQAATIGTRLQLIGATTFPDSYARTLREWRMRFFDRLDDVRRLGFDERFVRMWEYYLCYCEAAFLERTVNVGQFVWEKSRH